MFIKRIGSTRKQRTEQFLKKNGIAVNPNLPEIEPEDIARIKSPEEIVRRAVTAFITAQIAIDICSGNGAAESVEFFTPIMERFGLMGELTDDEKIYFDPSGCENISQDEAYQMQWRLEMCVSLFWACGFRKNMDFPSEITDITKLIKLIGSCGSFDELMSHVKMRTASEILDNADAIFRMDWACVEARIRNDNSISGRLNHDVVVEQHKGFNWLRGAYDAEDWDSVKPHT